MSSRNKRGEEGPQIRGQSSPPAGPQNPPPSGQRAEPAAGQADTGQAGESGGAWADRFDSSTLEPAEVPAFESNLNLLSQSGDPNAVPAGVDAQMLASASPADLPGLSVETPSVFANGRSVLNPGDGGVYVGLLDVCKIPTPAGPVPVPFVNIAMQTDQAEVSSKLGADGEGVGTADSFVSKSTGDQPGTAGGGILCSDTEGKLNYMTRSTNVRCGDEGMVRAFEITGHNGARDGKSYSKPSFSGGGGAGGRFGGLSLGLLAGLGGGLVAGGLLASLPALRDSLGLGADVPPGLPDVPGIPGEPSLSDYPFLAGIPGVPEIVAMTPGILPVLLPFLLGGGSPMGLAGAVGLGLPVLGDLLANGDLAVAGEGPFAIVARIMMNPFIAAQIPGFDAFGLQSLAAMIALPLALPLLGMLPPRLAGRDGMTVPDVPGVGLSGEPFNTISVAPGVPTPQEAEDTVCPNCKKPEDDHKVGESGKSRGYLSALTKKLDRQFKPQKPLVKKYLALDEERTGRRKSSNKGGKGSGKKGRKGSPTRSDRQEDLGDVTAQQKDINQKIEAQGPVLREDYSTGTYSQGYVVGVALCRCGAQALGACSGPANEAFRSAAKEAKLALVDSSPAGGCDCAAYQLLSRMTGAGHRVKALALKMYQPVAVAGNDGPPPSTQCPDCKDKLKDMLCNNDEPCGG